MFIEENTENSCKSDLILSYYTQFFDTNILSY